MHGRQILQGHFGKHYKLHFIKNGPVPRSLTPLRFVDSHSARRFLAQLHTPQSYWQWLTRDYHDVANFSGHQRDYLQVVSNWVLQGRLRIYEVELPDSHALSRSVASLQDRQGYQFQFAPMKQALANPAQPQRFNSIQQVYETLYDLAPNLEQLQSVVADLQLIPAPEQQTYSQLMDALAEGLTEERVALYINAPFKRPEPAGAAAETAANMPGNRKVELAPAASASRTDSGESQKEVPQDQVTKKEALLRMQEALRYRQLSWNHEQKKFSIIEAHGISRAEQALGRRFEPSNIEGVDFLDPTGLGKVSLKGPFLDKNLQPLKLEYQKKAAENILKHANANKAVDIHIIDTKGLDDEVFNAMQETLKGSKTKILYLR